MKELGVFITFKGEAHFCPKSPGDSFLLDSKVKSVHSKGAEVVFVGGKRSVFLQQIQKVDKDATIVFPEEGGGGTFRPSFATEAILPQPRDNLGGGVMSSRPSPGGTNKVFKTIVEPPSSIVPKVPPLGDERGDCGNEGDVVRGIPSKRGKSGGGEHDVPGSVNKNAVQPNEGRNSTAVRPSVATVREGELDKAELVDSIVKHVRIVDREVVIVTVRGVATEVEIPGDKPRCVAVDLN
jgi:hypothetical protein